jgi:hypothetical protein
MLPVLWFAATMLKNVLVNVTGRQPEIQTYVAHDRCLCSACPTTVRMVLVFRFLLAKLQEVREARNQG